MGFLDYYMSYYEASSGQANSLKEMIFYCIHMESWLSSMYKEETMSHKTLWVFSKEVFV